MKAADLRSLQRGIGTAPGSANMEKRTRGF